MLKRGRTKSCAKPSRRWSGSRPSSATTWFDATTARIDLLKTVEDRLATDLAALTAKTRDREVAELVDSGLADGRLLPAQKDWAIDLGRSNVAALTKYLETAQPIAALTGTQTRGKQPDATVGSHGLTAAELAVCTSTGVSPEDFAKAKAA